MLTMAHDCDEVPKTIEPKGISLAALRESLLKCKGDSAASRDRIKRLRTEINEVSARIAEHDQENESISSEINQMRLSRDDLQKQIEERTQQLDDIIAQNKNFVKDKVVTPADEGITAAREAIAVFEEMKHAGFKLQRLLRRENPEKADASTNIDLPYDAKPDVNSDLFPEVGSCCIENMLNHCLHRPCKPKSSCSRCSRICAK